MEALWPPAALAGPHAAVTCVPADELAMDPPAVAGACAVFAAGFPTEAAEGDETAAEAVSRMCSLYDPEDCLFWLLRLGGPGGEVAGLAIGTAYAASYYGASLAVAPAQRGRGYGRLLMHHVQAHALSAGFCSLTATVDAKAPALVAYYRRLGAEVEQTGISSPDSPPPPTLRIRKRFDAEVAAADLRESEALVLAGARRRAARNAAVAAAGAAALAAAAARLAAVHRGALRGA
mmetsp:Transcript_14014/g.48267  ORF Transcript_14014/g.48267 Transcript_14014/m.48267 type:complete len:234 (-) Transcript_14014:80-781(-)